MKTINHKINKRVAVQLTFLTLILSFSSACNRTRGDSENLVPLKAEVLISDISANKCLNLEKLNSQLQSPQFNVPAAIMTTNLKPLNEISRAKTEYFSYSSFYYKMTKANDLNLFTAAHQNDCQSIQLLTASNEVLTYNITNHSENQITFVLSDDYQENIPDFQKKAMKNRLEPYEYTLTYISPYEIKLIEKFRSIDPLCDNKKSLKFEVTKNISWADSEDALPKQYQIDPYYLGAVQQSLPVTITPPPISGLFAATTTDTDPISPADPSVTPPTDPETDPVTNPPADPSVTPPTDPETDPTVVVPPTEPTNPVRSSTDIISVDEILKIMLTPIRDELKLCS